ncbi:MAG: DUF4340 domain-containing protein [Treponema sp.]|jgi:hypothetical protein|nr:DUF4340 domain-containing protein [Treponema sp.]
MAYRRKLLILSSLVILLSLVYILSLVFDPRRVFSRSSAYTLLEGRLLDRADRIVIENPGLTVNLLRRDNVWLVSRGGNEYPARQLRVGDLLAALSRRAAYPVLATSASSHRQLGLEEGISRITVRGGAGLPLLDLLIGKGGTGRELYLRKANSDQVRSGEDIFTVYTESALASWYDLRLFPNGPEAGEVQRLIVYHPAGEGEGGAFTRSGKGWNLRDLAIEADDTRIDSYIRGILDAEGDDFIPASAVPEPFPVKGRLVLELGNGTVLTLSLGEGEASRYIAKLSGSPYLYALADWTVERLFRDAGYFRGR